MKKFFLVFILFLTSSCIETVVAGTALTGVVLAQDKPIEDTKDDVVLTTKIDAEFLQAGLKDPRNKIGVTVDRKRVLLTGLVENGNIAKVANEKAWKVDGVKEVIDEIQIEPNKPKVKNFVEYFKDAAITTQLESKILVAKDIPSLDIEVVTVNGVVYLIGVAKNEDQIRNITDIASSINGVKKVISHIVVQ